VWASRASGSRRGRCPQLGGKGFTVVVRSGGKVRKERHDDLRAALGALDRFADELADDASARPIGGGLIRRLEPVQQVVGRIELTGPGRLRAGIDVRGDGSSEAFTGRVRRQLVEQKRRESAVDALRRVLA
jgi:hypothetical protein